jgi:hypothetical protein
LHGMGGVGKTQIALSYAFANKAAYKAVWWVNASDNASILLSFNRIAQGLVDWAAKIRGSALNFTRIAYDLGLGQFVSPTTGEVQMVDIKSRLVTDAVIQWLSKKENCDWLMIFDSVDDIESVDLQSFFPNAPTGDILVTSRRKQLASLGTGVEISCLEPFDAVDLLLRSGELTKQGWSSLA